jgi:hypothetical protein
MGTSFDSISPIHFVYQDKNPEIWRKFMKTTMKLFLVLAFLSATVLAEGEMGNGGRTGCTTNCPPPPCTANCLVQPAAEPAVETTDKIVVLISKFIPWMF